MEFNERFRVNAAAMPAWVCDNASCTVRRIAVRGDAPSTPTSKDLVKASKQLRAKALRTVMKSRARTTRVQNRLAARGGAAKRRDS
jgi:hypothetical protein